MLRIELKQNCCLNAKIKSALDIIKKHLLNRKNRVYLLISPIYFVKLLLPSFSKSTHSTNPDLKVGVCSGLILSGIFLLRPEGRSLYAPEVSSIKHKKVKKTNLIPHRRFLYFFLNKIHYREGACILVP